MEAKYEALFSWAANHNIFIHPHIALHFYNEMGYGFKAAQPIKKGDVLMTIPKQSQFTIENSLFYKVWSNSSSIYC